MSAAMPDAGNLLDDIRAGEHIASWQPSWEDSNISLLDLFSHEDALTPVKSAEIMDAVRLADNRHVVLKKIEASSKELQIARFLSFETIPSDPRNHTVPILQTIDDPNNKDVAFIVMLAAYELSTRFDALENLQMRFASISRSVFPHYKMID
ncbi:hypothetical protein C0995_006478 [Termitomyces sp. Mi166|nr:hypothetical protein C0995_006478 [Termitomyces sp. Mi166\